MVRIVAIAALVAASSALAQGYPSKPIRLMVGYAPGGSAEAGARPLAKALEPLLGQPLVFEYRPGAAGGVAMEAIAKAPADGYLLYYYDSGPLTVAPHLNKVGYDKIASFTQLGHVCGSGSLLVVHPSTPFQTVNDVVSLSKRNRTSGATAPRASAGRTTFRANTSRRHRRGPAARALQGRRPGDDRPHGRPDPDALLLARPGDRRGEERQDPSRSPSPRSQRSQAFPNVPTMDEARPEGLRLHRAGTASSDPPACRAKW